MFVISWSVCPKQFFQSNLKIYQKKFTAIIYEFFYERVFVRLGYISLPNDQQSSLLRKFINYGQKSFITLALGPNNIYFTVVIY
jgi:hypothetical protein